ncbi:MAG: aminotransferase class V-fold PLP-dependent enzyme [Planctomycetota bacterium]
MSIQNKLDPTNEQDWAGLAGHWLLRPDTIYLNHGSFGLCPTEVRSERRKWIRALDEQPMDFYLRQMEPALIEARTELGKFIGTDRKNLIFVDNATYAMNVVAKSLPLQENDEVLISDLEYGAVDRIWDRVRDDKGITIVRPQISIPIQSNQQIVEEILAAVTEKTKLAVISHVTSATALILPIREICLRLRERGVPVCIDGPHAPAQVDLDIESLGCDFYCASCHKWLCAPLGTGFLYVHPEMQSYVVPPVLSWGRLKPFVPESWDEEFTWLGTRDPSGFLSIPKAIGFMNGIGLDSFRNRSRYLARWIEERLVSQFGTQPIAVRDYGFYGSMAHVPLPSGNWDHLQRQLWEEVGIEVMVNSHQNRPFIRVSCHLYNNTAQLDTLAKALDRLTS